MSEGAAFRLNMSTTQVIEFNAFENQIRDAHDLPPEPTLDLYVKLTTKDFHWAVDDLPSNNYFVVCQLSKSSFYSARRSVPASKCSIYAYLCIPWRHIGGTSAVLAVLPSVWENFQGC